MGKESKFCFSFTEILQEKMNRFNNTKTFLKGSFILLSFIMRLSSDVWGILVYLLGELDGPFIDKFPGSVY